MTSDVRPRAAVVVGIDETPSAQRALSWAAGEAALRGLPLVVCNAYPNPGWPADAATEEANQRQAWRLVRLGAETAREAVPGLDAVPYAAEGSVRRVLLDAVAEPALLVVGARGRGSLAALLLGSAGVDLAGRAPCPVAIVRETTQAGPHLFAGNVVVGVDGESSGTVVAVAFAEAALRGVSLVVVHAGILGPVDAWRDEAFGEVHEERALDGWEPLEAAVEPFRVRYPRVPVKLALRDGVPAANGLLSAARGAAVLVVGSAGYGRVGGALGRSISRAAVTRAPCPVIVVPTTAAVPTASAGKGEPR